MQLFARLDQRRLEPRHLFGNVRSRDVVFRDDLFGHAVHVDLAPRHARGYANSLKAAFCHTAIVRRFFVELALKQCFQLPHRRLGVRSLGDDDEFGALARRQHHQSHDALAIDLFAVLLDGDVAGIFVGGLDEQRHRSRVDAELVDHRDLPARRPGFRTHRCSCVTKSFPLLLSVTIPTACASAR